jgi:hypothetical protein
MWVIRMAFSFFNVSLTFYLKFSFYLCLKLKHYNMKLELKNIKFYESMSEETNCFQADLFINGKKIASVKNQGHGGPTDYHVLDFKNQQILRDAEQFCLSLPKEKIDGMMSDFEFQPTLESRIDDLFEAWLKVKAENKMLKHMEKGLLYGKNINMSYTICTWNVPLKAMLMTANGREVIKQKIIKIKEQGLIVLNTNIPKELL